MIKHRVRTVVLSAVAATSLILGAGSAGATDLKDVLKVGTKANQVAQQSQTKINKIVDQTDKIIGDYKTVLRTIEGLRIYNAQLQRQIDLQVVEMGKLTKSIKGVTYVKRQITPLMMNMVDALGEFIDHDLPIKREERIAGIERLRELMDNPNVDASEKFRFQTVRATLFPLLGVAGIAQQGCLLGFIPGKFPFTAFIFLALFISALFYHFQ